MKKINRSRPNAWENRYNQWVLAGKIALITNAVPDIQASLDKGYHPMSNCIYFDNDKKPFYSVIGQEYLRRLNVTITDL